MFLHTAQAQCNHSLSTDACLRRYSGSDYPSLIVQAGQDDGSCFTRPMTDAELDEQSRQIAAM